MQNRGDRRMLLAIIHEAQIFVAVFGHSNCTCVEAS